MSVKKILSNMTLKEKIGQLFQVGFSGKELTPEIKEMISEYNIGGIIYFSRNIENTNQVAELSTQLQETAVKNNSGLPLLISADQEGGTVTRLNGGTHFPGNMTLGATRKPELAKKAGEAVGKELRAVGINMNLAPVLDVNNNPDNPVIGVRSYGEEPELVANMGKAYTKGLQGEGVIGCGKHFPGHGDTATDSHLDLPIIEHSRERLDRVELFPFRKAINIGIDSIMTAHVYFPTIEPRDGVPATLSQAVLTGLLRDELGFEGLIITDCMEMEAIVQSVGTVKGAVKTLQAGSDMVLISHSYDKQKKAIQEVIKAVDRGDLSEERIDKSVKRILSLKEKRLSLQKPLEVVLGKLDKEFSQRVAQEIARQGVTLVSDKEGLLPLDIKGKKIRVIDFGLGRVSLVENNSQNENNLVDLLRERGARVNHIYLKGKNELPAADDQDITIICSYNAVNDKSQVKIAHSAAAEGRVIILAIRNPFDFNVLGELAPFITTYDYSPANLEAAVDIISGRIKPQGKLPVTVKS